ncbi:1747_t:CDS:1, partial [Dentiscutata heterogama]
LTFSDDFEHLKIEKQIIRKANICDKIKNIIYFIIYNTEEKLYMIIINKVACLYAISLINYENKDNKVKIIAVKRFFDMVEFYQSKEEANKKAEYIKEK